MHRYTEKVWKLNTQSERDFSNFTHSANWSKILTFPINQVQTNTFRDIFNNGYFESILLGTFRVHCAWNITIFRFPLRTQRVLYSKSPLLKFRSIFLQKMIQLQPILWQRILFSHSLSLSAASHKMFFPCNFIFVLPSE